MTPHQPLRPTFTPCRNERSQSRPGTEHVSTTDLDILAEVPPYLVDHPPHVLFGRRHFLTLGVHFGRCVGGPGDHTAFPGKKEDDTAVRGGGVEKTHAGGGIVRGKRDMNAGRRSDNRFMRRIVEGKKRVGVWAGCVDDALSGCEKWGDGMTSGDAPWRGR